MTALLVLIRRVEIGLIELDENAVRALDVS